MEQVTENSVFTSKYRRKPERYLKASQKNTDTGEI